MTERKRSLSVGLNDSFDSWVVEVHAHHKDGDCLFFTKTSQTMKSAGLELGEWMGEVLNKVGLDEVHVCVRWEGTECRG